MKHIVLSLISILLACSNTSPLAGHQRAGILNIQGSTIAQVDVNGQTTLIFIDTARFWQSDRLN
ncbi:hypothetical protein RI844_17825 [Thalassotalea fonticola]|uniref:Uncharacterized protein n=1 Tax=Thalassotalea fonticola TaxID=3065649 RepID=A0ABZ0GMQ7_9GAMM|nr:hypothetical protein RI844_17825 [Colwelliaceae bacterium S1-1]